MKIIKLIFAVLFGLYALAQCVQFLKLVTGNSHISAVLGSLCGICIGAAISLVLFRSAFRQNK